MDFWYSVQQKDHLKTIKTSGGSTMQLEQLRRYEFSNVQNIGFSNLPEKENNENDDYSKTNFSKLTNFTILKRGKLVDSFNKQ